MGFGGYGFGGGLRVVAGGERLNFHIYVSERLLEGIGDFALYSV